MSYDLAVFDPKPELRDRAFFMKWYDSRTEWADGLDYNEPSNASPTLQRWLREMIKTFPTLNGKLRPTDFASNDWTADYSTGGDIICIPFPSGKAGPACEMSRLLASKHGVGLFDAGGAWFLRADGTLEFVHGNDGTDAVDVEATLARLMRQLRRPPKP